MKGMLLSTSINWIVKKMLMDLQALKIIIVYCMGVDSGGGLKKVSEAFLVGIGLNQQLQSICKMINMI